MKLYSQILVLMFRKYILRKSTGLVVRDFATTMGVVYIKLAQILATQNYGDIFTDEDRVALSSICDDCSPISFPEIKHILENEYRTDLENIFSYIDEKPVGAASISQVHRAILKSGQEVAVKVKRKDIARTVDRDISQIKKLMHRFGKVVKFGNFMGGDRALDLYLEWIRQETDFCHELSNIKVYQDFADSVNGKLHDAKNIKVPKLYEQYCTENVIVMEFIKTPTINQMRLTPTNKQRIATALNDYIRLSFWAMFNDQTIVFHGDPHSGNICVDEVGNICFLDMGLLYVMNERDAKLCREFFLTAYSGNYEKLYSMLIGYGELSSKEQALFKDDCRKYCQEAKGKELTCYFTDMIGVCAKYEMVPPDFLFNMAKAFICLNGISNFTNNEIDAKALLQDQITSFLLKRSLNDFKTVITDGVKILPNLVTATMHDGVFSAAKQAVLHSRCNLVTALDNIKESFDLLSRAYGDDWRK